MGLPGSICELWPRLGITEKLRYSYFSRAPLAQLAEQLTLNQRVQGSSPWRCTNQSPVRIPRTGLCCIPHKVGGSGLQLSETSSRSSIEEAFTQCSFLDA